MKVKDYKYNKMTATALFEKVWPSKKTVYITSLVLLYM